MASVATIAVSMTARTARFNRRMKGAGKSVKRFSRTANLAHRSLLKLASAFVAVLGARAVASMVRAQAQQADALAKTSRKLGIAVEDLQAMALAAKLAGIATNTMTMGLQRMVRRVSEAAKGTGEAQAALKELKLDAEELNKLSPDKQFERIARALSKFGSADRVRLAFKVFDSEGVSLVNLYADAIEESRQSLAKFGATLTDLDVHQIERLNDVMTQTKEITSSLAKIAISELSISISALSKTLFDLSGEFLNFGLYVRFAIHQMTEGIANLLGVFSGGLESRFRSEVEKLHRDAAEARDNAAGGGLGGPDLPARQSQFKQVDLRRTHLPFGMDAPKTEQKKQTGLLEKISTEQEKIVKALEHPKPILLRAS